MKLHQNAFKHFILITQGMSTQRWGTWGQWGLYTERNILNCDLASFMYTSISLFPAEVCLVVGLVKTLFLEYVHKEHFRNKKWDMAQKETKIRKCIWPLLLSHSRDGMICWYDKVQLKSHNFLSLHIPIPTECCDLLIFFLGNALNFC